MRAFLRVFFLRLVHAGDERGRVTFNKPRQDGNPADKSKRIKQPRPRRQQPCHKLAYFTMKPMVCTLMNGLHSFHERFSFLHISLPFSSFP